MQNVSHRDDWVLKGRITNWAGGAQQCQVWAIQTLPVLLAWFLLNSKHYLKGFKKQANNDNFLKTPQMKKPLYFLSISSLSDFGANSVISCTLGSIWALSELHCVPTFPFLLPFTAPTVILFCLQLKYGFTQTLGMVCIWITYK